MDRGVSGRWYGGLRGYWKRRTKYEKLNGSSRRRRRAQVELELGSTGKRRRFWRIKISPKLRFLRRIPSPKKLLLRLRDAYVKMMLGFANSRVFSASYGGAVVTDSIAGFGQRPVKEYDDKMIVEIYKSMVAAQRQLMMAHHTADKPEPEIACSR